MIRKPLLLTLTLTIAGFLSAATLHGQTATWTRAGVLVYAAADSFTLNDGRVFVPSSAFFSTGSQMWNPLTNVWTAVPPSLYLRLEAASIVLNDGRVLVTGGQTSMNTAEIYDPASNSWSLSRSAMVNGRYLHRATKLGDGRILFTGGCTLSGCGAAASMAEIYDPVSDTFVQTGSMSMVRTLHTATLLSDGKVLIAGGYTNTGTGVTNVAEVFDPLTGKFSPAGRMKATRSEHTATLLADGRILVTGGSTDYGAVLRSAEIYTPSTGAWTRTGAMPYLRYEHNAILLNNGKVLVAGGYSIIRDAYVVLRGAELYDPATGVFTKTTGMIKPRLQFGLNSLPDGRVMAVGGDYAVIGPHKVYPGDAEIYQP
jgi:hypothetical protein